MAGWTMGAFTPCSERRARGGRISQQARKRSCGIRELRLRRPFGASRRTDDENGRREDSKNATSSLSAMAAIWTQHFSPGLMTRSSSNAGRHRQRAANFHRKKAAAVLCASLLGLGMAFFACTQLIPALGLGWSDAVCLGGNPNPPQTARTDE